MALSRGHLTKVWLLALTATIGFDLFLHAGVLNQLYSSGDSFLLPPEEAFRRIPVGYASFAALTGLLVWLARRLALKGWKEGLLFGLLLGAVIWGSLTLGLYSISTAAPLLLLGWFAGQTIELGIAGAVVGAGLAAIRLRPLAVIVAVFFVSAVLLGIILQNILNFQN